MKYYQNANIKESCFGVQQEWRKLIDEISQFKKKNLINGEVAGTLISKLVEFECAVMDNQQLILKEAFAVGQKAVAGITETVAPESRKLKMN